MKPSNLKKHLKIEIFQGFETRGTILAQRITAWENLCESTRPSGILTVNPNELIPSSTSPPILHNNVILPPLKNKLWGDKNQSISSTMFWVPNNTSKGIIDDDEDSEALEDDWVSLLKGPGTLLGHEDHHDHQHLSSDGFFCDGPSNLIFKFKIENSNHDSFHF